jgi:hypothetical protein
MKKLAYRDMVLSIALSSLVAGCASTSSEPRDLFSIPVTGQFSDGRPAAGQATARSDGMGVFWVQVPGGPKCSGTYAVRDPSPTLVVPGICSDGRKAQVVITRQADLMSGSAIVQLDGGLRGQFVFGNLTYGQTFGNGGIVLTR